MGFVYVGRRSSLDMETLCFISECESSRFNAFMRSPSINWYLIFGKDWLCARYSFIILMVSQTLIPGVWLTLFGIRRRFHQCTMWALLRWQVKQTQSNQIVLALLNVIETMMNLAYVYLALVSQWPGAPIVGFGSALMTLSKTVLYWAQEYYCGYCAVGHNNLFDLFFLWIIPNGWVLLLWTIVIFWTECLALYLSELGSSFPLSLFGNLARTS